MKKVFYISLIPLFLMGCTQAEYYANAAEQAAKKANDIEAGVLEDAGCAIRLGAWARMNDPRKRNGLFYTCVPDAKVYGIDLTK